MTPWAALAEAVIRQAVQDLLVRSAPHFGAATDANPSSDNKIAAIRFLTDASGRSADDRAFWCHIAGKNPDHLRKTIVALLEGDDSLLDHYPGSKLDRLAALEETRALYVARKRGAEGAQARWLEATQRRKANLERHRQLEAIRRERAERRAEMLKWQAGRRTALDAEIARIVDALKEGPRSIGQIGNAIGLTYLPARSRLEEAARRGLVEHLGKGVWRQTASGAVGNTVVELLPRAAAY